MKRLVLINSLVLLSAVGVSKIAEAQENDPKQQLENVIKDSINALNKQDFEGVVKNLHPTDYTQFGAFPQKTIEGPFNRKDLLELLKTILPALKVQSSQPSDLKIHVKGDGAYVTYLAVMRLGEKVSYTVRYTEIFVREKGVWYKIHSHQSMLNGL